MMKVLLKCSASVFLSFFLSFVKVVDQDEESVQSDGSEAVLLLNFLLINFNDENIFYVISKK